MTPGGATSVSDQKPSVLFVLPSLQGGGAERVATTLLRHLDPARFTLALAILDGTNPVFARDLPSDIEVIDLGCRRVRYAPVSLLRLIWQRRPTVVFSMMGHLNLMLALLKPLLPGGVRLFARETNALSAMLEAEPGGEMWRLGYRWLYRRLDNIVSQSESNALELVRDFHVAPGRVRVIRNPLDIERIGQLAAEPLDEEPWGRHDLPLVAAGRLAHVKGFDILLEAIALLGNPRVHLTILGEGPLRGDLELLAEDLGIAHQVRFLGFQPNPYKYFARAGAVVLSSRFENFPNVVLEALACGVPVIATPAEGGIHEMAEQESNVILADAVSARSLATALAAHLVEKRQPHVPADLAAYSATRVAAQFEALFLGKGVDSERHPPTHDRWHVLNGN